MNAVEIKDQLATLVREIWAQTVKIEVVSAKFDKVIDKLDRVTVKPVTANLGRVAVKLVTALDAGSPTPTTSMASRVDIHGMVPPSSGCSSVTIDWLVPELPARCSTPVLIHDIGHIPDAATSLCPRRELAPWRSTPLPRAHRLAAVLELDKRAPTKGSMLGFGADTFDHKSLRTDAFDDKSSSAPVSLEIPPFVGLGSCAVPKFDTRAHTICSRKCFDIIVSVASEAKVSLFREDLFLGSSSPDKVQTLRPVPWPSFADDTIVLQSRSPWPLFKVTGGSTFHTDAIVRPFNCCCPLYSRVTSSATKLQEFLGLVSPFSDCISVNDLCNLSMVSYGGDVLLIFKEVRSDIQWVQAYNVSLYAPLSSDHHVSGIGLQVLTRSLVPCWFSSGKQLECFWGAEHLLGEKYGAGSTKIFQGSGLVICREDVNLHDATRLQNLSADWGLFSVAEWKGTNQVAGNCKQSSQDWYHTVQSDRTIPFGEPLEYSLDAITTVKWHGTNLIESKLILFQYKAPMRDGYTMFAVTPMLQSGLFTRLTSNLLLGCLIGTGELVCSSKHSPDQLWQGHSRLLFSQIPVAYAENYPKLSGSAANGFQCGSNLGLSWANQRIWRNVWDSGGCTPMLCSSEKWWNMPWHCFDQLQWSSGLLARASWVWWVAWDMDVMWFFTCRGQAPFQGGMNAIIRLERHRLPQRNGFLPSHI